MSARPTQGFTLLEVLVALAVLAAAFASVSDLAGGALRNHEFARDLNSAVLLARARMAEVEEQYEDSGFKDFDEEEQGDFSAEGRPDVRWKVEVLRPSPELSADQLMASLAGATGSDPTDLLTKLLGGGQPAARGSGPTTSASGSPAAAMAASLLQSQLTAFGEVVKRSLREIRLTVSWPSGRRTRTITLATHLVVLNPRAPGGAHGDSPDVPVALGGGLAGQGASLPGVPVPPAGLPSKPGPPAGVPR